MQPSRIDPEHCRRTKHRLEFSHVNEKARCPVWADDQRGTFKVIAVQVKGSIVGIGIDISPTACGVMAKRLRVVCTCRKANALARRTRLHRPRFAVERGKIARHSAV